MTETADIWTINSRRAVMKIPVISLCAQAGVGTRTWYDAIEGTKAPKPSTIAKLNMALQRFKLAYGGDSGPLTVRAAYTGALMLAALMLKSDGKAALFSDPARKATGDKQWLQAARVRRLAFWISNYLMGFRVSEIGRAAGLTKQAVSKAITDVADDPDPEMQRVCNELERMFS
ncbi:hypothetical protein [Mesorhizobium sp.]|uniref:hypothetical protein n=1 Tax=Mesorhizobium sp. TaxID=1871066 RepID=UPI000FE9DEE7|nr:hypothetical protein [Mesorhizobium sp.]RWN78056.1 MAG: hypothetical protein EOS02_09860 [Mesorhizobium sp.]